MKWMRVDSHEYVPIGAIWCHLPEDGLYFMRIDKEHTRWCRDDTVLLVSVCIHSTSHPSDEGTLFQTGDDSSLYLYVGD